MVEDLVERLLEEARRGDAPARAELLAVLHRELKELAERCLGDERPNHSLQATALVNEACMRLLRNEPARARNRTQFLALGATVMRRILVDHARRRGAHKRVEGRQRITLDEGLLFAERRDLDVLAVHEALERLHALDERMARVVELKFFAGLEESEAAALLGVSHRTVQGDWRVARAWLRSELDRGGGGSGP